MSSVFLPIDDPLTHFLERDRPFYAAHCAVLRPSYSVRPAELITKCSDLTTPVIATPYSGFNMEIREGGQMSGAAMRHTIASAEADTFARDAIVRTRHQCLGCGARRSLYRYRG